MTKDEQHAIDLIEKKYAMDYYYYRISCTFCSNKTSECEYASDAAEEAYNLGYREVIFKQNFQEDRRRLACNECLASGIWRDYYNNGK